ncbi:MAG: HAD family hydrolase [Planctomycetota bacterium]|jgi:beta-phosphoglucomutase
MLQAVIFDFDGVVTDSEMLHLRAFNEILAKSGLEIPTEEYYKEYLGFTDVECFETLVDKGRLVLGADSIQDLVVQKNDVFEKLADNDAAIILGVPEFLDMLKQNNVPTAICSGALLAEIELILERANLRSFFEVIVSADDVTKGKPDPEGFLLTLRKLNDNRPTAILPAQCIVIEDSHWGLEAARAAAMHTVAVTNSYAAEQLAMAEKTIGNLNELTMTDLQQLCG